MPPKKPDPNQRRTFSPTSAQDLRDLAFLPPLNEFIFTTLFAFKYRLSQHKVEEALRVELDLSLQPPSAEPEIIEAQKRNRVIDLKNLLEHAEASGYLTKEETLSMDSVSENKKRQVLARSTNDLLVSIQLPLRREK